MGCFFPGNLLILKGAEMMSQAGGGVGVQDGGREGHAAPVTDEDPEGCTRRIRMRPAAQFCFPWGPRDTQILKSL